MDLLICLAIVGRRYLTFRYDGGYRSVEPHCFGTNKAGQKVLKAYQVEGYAGSEKTQGWKLFEVTRIQGIQKLDASFREARPGYILEDPAIAKVCCHLHRGEIPNGHGC